MPRAEASTKTSTATPHTLTFIPANPSASYTTTTPSPPPARHPNYHIRWAAPLSPSSFSSPTPAATKQGRPDAWTAEEKERCLQALTLIWERAPHMGKTEAWGMAGRLMRDVWGMGRSGDAVAKVWRAELGAVWEERRRARGEGAGRLGGGGGGDGARVAVAEQLAVGAVDGAAGMAGEREEGEREERNEELGGGVGEGQEKERFGGELSEELERELFGGELSELSEELERDLFGEELDEEHCEELSEELERELFGGDEVSGEE